MQSAKTIGNSEQWCSDIAEQQFKLYYLQDVFPLASKKEMQTPQGNHKYFGFASSKSWQSWNTITVSHNAWFICWGENSICQVVYSRQLFWKVAERAKVMLPFICPAVWGGICSKYPLIYLICLYSVLDYKNKKERRKTLEKFCKLQSEAFPWDNHRYLPKTLSGVYYAFVRRLWRLCAFLCNTSFDMT